MVLARSVPVQGDFCAIGRADVRVDCVGTVIGARVTGACSQAV